MSDERRIGNSEREAAVVALQVHLNAGRLTSSEYEDRSIQARQARTRAELDPLFADLPRPHPDEPAVSASTSDSVTSQSGATPATDTPSTANPSTAPSTGPGSGQIGGLLPDPLGAWVLALTPFAALFLFFATGHHWQWFLLIPITGLIVRGPQEGRSRHGHPRRRRDR